ncbi:MAG: FHA domain-containing protein [Fimbriimonas sp.]
MSSGRVAGVVVAGVAGATAAWALSEPFAPTARDGIQAGTVHFTLGSFYGWYAHLLLGALIAGPIAFAISATRVGFGRASLSALVAGILGGGLACGLDALSDWLMIRAIRGGGGGFYALFSPMWNVFVALGLAMAVAVATQPTRARLARGFLAGVGAGVASFFAGQIVAPIAMIALIARGGLQNPDLVLWQPWDPGRLVERIIMGLVVGLALGLGTYAFRQVWIRHELARGEGRDFPLENGPNRIGSAEGIEVALRGTTDVEPIHAQLDVSQGRWYITAFANLPMLVNGHPTGQSWLNDGDLVQVGSAMLRLTSHPGARYGPPPGPIEKRPEPVLIDAFGNPIPLGDGVHSVGRDPLATLKLPYDESVSRRHAEIEVRNGEAIVRDLGSSNGTTVNGSPVRTPTLLNSGDEVAFGRTRVTFRT